MNDRLDAVEKKITELEQSVPREVEEWRKLHKVINLNQGCGNSKIFYLSKDK